MTVAFDAFTNGGAGGFTHTPVGTPRGILVLIRMQNATDVVTGVTYGGVTVNEVNLSPLIASGSEGGTCYGYHLGTGIPTGAQTCTITVSAGTARGTCFSLTASADTEVVNTDTIDVIAAPIGGVTDTLALSGRTCFVAQAIWSATGGVVDLTPLSGWTGRQETDEGSETNACYSYDTIGSSDVTFGFTGGTVSDAAVLAVAVSEVSASGATGTAAQTLPSLNQAVTATEKFTGTVAQVLPKLAQAAAGATTSALSAVVAQNLPKLTQAATGAEKITGTVVQTLPKLTQDAAGDVVSPGVAGAVAQTLPSLTQSASGTVVIAVTGTVAQVLPALRQAIAGIVDNHGQDIAAPSGPPPGGLSKRRKREEKDTRRRRILLDDGRIIVPADDEEYRRIVSDIISGYGRQPVEQPTKKPTRKRLKNAVVQPPKVASVRVSEGLPSEFYTTLENNRTGVLNYLSILEAWQNYLSELDEEEAVTLLLLN